MTRGLNRLALAIAIVCSTAAVSLAQQSTTTETKSFEVLAVYGNQLIVRLPEGTRELTVPDDFRFTVNGQQLSVSELKPGLKGTATITTRTTVTPVTVTEVKSGTVVLRSGSTLIVRTSEGVKSFTQSEVDKRGVRIVRAGKPAQLSDFREGDQLSATIITTMPPHVLTEKEVQATTANTAAAAGGTPPAQQQARASSGAGSSAPAAPLSARSQSGSAGASAPPAQASAGGAARILPKTASSWPLLAFASLLMLAIGLTLTLRRRLVR
jgi:hypothetical protein